MATTIVTHPAEFLQPKQIVRQGIVVAIVLALGVGLGMLLDTGRQTVAVEAGPLTQGQQAASDRAIAQASALGFSPANIAAGQRLQGLADSFAASQRLQDYADALAGPSTPVAPATGQEMLTDLANRGAIPAAAAVVSPQVVPEHGPFTAMQYRDPSTIQQRFVYRDANLDPDVAVAGPAEWMRFGIPSAATTGPGSIDDTFAPGDVFVDKNVVLGRGSYGYSPSSHELVPGLPY